MKKRELRGCGCMRASIQFLDEFPTPWRDMIEYLKGEKLIEPKTEREKGYNSGIQTAINMIGSCPTQLKEKYK